MRATLNPDQPTALAGEDTLYIACMDMEFGWPRSQVALFRHRWRQGATLWAIARELDRDPDEVMFLMVDQIRREFIRPRR